MADPESPVFTFRAEVFFDEFDALRILHHSRYLRHLERAQQRFFQHLLGVDDFNPDRDEDIYVVVRNVKIDYRAPINQPGPVEVRYRVSRIRAAGLTMPFEIWSGDGATLHCSGQRTVCRLSGLTHQPCEWTPAFRQALELWAAAPAAV